MSNNCLCSVKWWKMIASPLMSALERDEQFLSTVLRNAEGDPGLRLDQLDIVPADPSANSVTRLHVRGRKGRNLKSFYKSLIVKRHPEQHMRRQYQQDPAFCNEAVVYGSVLPALHHSMADNDARLLPFSPCLHASTSVIVLDDPQANGYCLVQRFKGLDLDHATAAFQALGRFHAVSLSLKHQDSSAFEDILSQVQEVVFVQEAAPVFGASLEIALELAITHLKQCSEQVIFDAIQILQRLQGQTFQSLVALLTPKEPLSVLCHGDFWVNNVMFRYDSEKVMDVVFTDLQVVRYSSLATDILHFMYTSLEPGLSRDYSDDLIKVYHKSLSETLTKLSPTTPLITLEEVHNEIESHALYGLLMSFLVLPNITNSAKDLEEPNESYCNSFSFTYPQRVKDVVLEFIDKSFI